LDAASPPSAPGIYRPVALNERLYQGEILERAIEWVPKYDDASPDHVVGVEPRLHRLAIVMIQECDLAQDWSRRTSEVRIVTELTCVLLCPAFPADELRTAQDINNKRWEPIRANKNERYQYLAEVPKELDGISEGHAALLIDFKSVFAVRTIELYRQLRMTGAPRRRCRLETPWAEHLQSRFAAYQARIGLPRDHFVPENRRTEAASR